MSSSTARAFALSAISIASGFAIAPGCGKTTESSVAATASTATPATSTSVAAGAAVLPISPNQPGEWLHTEKNHIMGSDQKPVHLRGANLQDTRSCDACSWEEPHPQEVARRLDELTDNWKANFVRLTLESYAADPKATRAHYKNALEDESYLKDIEGIVHRIEKKPGVYVMVTVWHDPTIDPNGWPTEQTRTLWKKLAPRFASSPRVLFGVVTEPEHNEDGAQDPQVWDQMNKTVQTIRDAEGSGMHHIVVVQGTGGWSRRLAYYVNHPITAAGGIDVAYEIHIYDPKPTIDAFFDGPAKTLPAIIGEFGPIDDKKLANMSVADCAYMMQRAEAAEVPYLGWTFHMRCPPNLLVDNSKNGCGDGMKLEPTPWGTQLKAELAKPYGAK